MLQFFPIFYTRGNRKIDGLYIEFAVCTNYCRIPSDNIIRFLNSGILKYVHITIYVLTSHV